MSTGTHETVAERYMADDGTPVWQIACGDHARFRGLSRESVEDVWREHVSAETGRGADCLPEWKP